MEIYGGFGTLEKYTWAFFLLKFKTYSDRVLKNEWGREITFEWRLTRKLSRDSL